MRDQENATAMRARARGAFALGVPVRLSFFFSRSRRHTRCLSAWSSDVCSSDLASLLALDEADYVLALAIHHAHRPAIRNDVVHRQRQHVIRFVECQQRSAQQAVVAEIEGLVRPEERRGGKDWRARSAKTAQR